MGILQGFWLHPLLVALQTASFKFQVLLSIFCGTKITFWRGLAPIFRSTLPSVMSYPPINIEISPSPPNLPPPSPIIKYFQDSIPPLVKGGFKL